VIPYGMWVPVAAMAGLYLLIHSSRNLLRWCPLSPSASSHCGDDLSSFSARREPWDRSRDRDVRWHSPDVLTPPQSLFADTGVARICCGAGGRPQYTSHLIIYRVPPSNSPPPSKKILKWLLTIPVGCIYNLPL